MSVLGVLLAIIGWCLIFVILVVVILLALMVLYLFYLLLGITYNAIWIYLYERNARR